MVEERTIISVQRQGESGMRDLEVSAETGAAELAQKIAGALGWDRVSWGSQTQYNLYIPKLNRVLQPDESLLRANLGDGTLIVMVSAGDTLNRTKKSPPINPMHDKPQTLPGETSPVVGFRPLPIDQTEEQKPSSSSGNNSDKFPWEKIDV